MTCPFHECDQSTSITQLRNPRCDLFSKVVLREQKVVIITRHDFVILEHKRQFVNLFQLLPYPAYRQRTFSVICSPPTNLTNWVVAVVAMKVLEKERKLTTTGVGLLEKLGILDPYCSVNVHFSRHGYTTVYLHASCKG